MSIALSLGTSIRPSDQTPRCLAALFTSALEQALVAATQDALNGGTDGP